MRLFDRTHTLDIRITINADPALLAVLNALDPTRLEKLTTALRDSSEQLKQAVAHATAST